MYINTNQNKEKTVKFLKLLVEKGFKLDENIRLERFTKDKTFNPIYLKYPYKESGRPTCITWWGNHDDSLTNMSNILNLETDYNQILKELKIKQTMNYSYNVSANSVTLFVDNKPYIAKSDHPNFKKIREFIKVEKFDDAVKLFDLTSVVNSQSNGKITVKNNGVFYRGEKQHNYVAGRILALIREGFNVTPIVNFLEDLYNNNPLVKENKNHYLVNDLYSFLEKNDLPLNADGGFLAWKRVKNTGFDIHSNTIKYEVGQFVEEDFNKVDKNRDNTCSSGLHFASSSYYSQSGFGNGDENKTLLVKVMPSWVCSIPTDYNNSKGRAYKMFVYAEYNEKLEKNIKRTVISNTNNKQKRNHLGQFCS